MGIVDKNYLNRIGQKIKDDLKNQPCGCDCHCRPKFEDDGTPPVPPVCNCKLSTNRIVGDYTDGRGSLNTGFLYLPIDGVQNCPFNITFRWINQSFVSATVTLKTSTQVIPMTEGVDYTITLNPGDWYSFIFTGTPDVFDQYLYLEAFNDTCQEQYGEVGSYTLLAI